MGNEKFELRASKNPWERGRLAHMTLENLVHSPFGLRKKNNF